MVPPAQDYSPGLVNFGPRWCPAWTRPLQKPALLRRLWKRWLRVGQHQGLWALICDRDICSSFTIFIAAGRKVLFEHGKVHGTTIRIIRSAGIVHVLEFYKLYALQIHIVGAEDRDCLRRKQKIFFRNSINVSPILFVHVLQICV